MDEKVGGTRGLSGAQYQRGIRPPGLLTEVAHALVVDGTATGIHSLHRNLPELQELGRKMATLIWTDPLLVLKPRMRSRVMTLPGFPSVAILATVAGRHPPHSFSQDTRSPDTVQCRSQELSWSWLHFWKPSI